LRTKKQGTHLTLNEHDDDDDDDDDDEYTKKYLTAVSVLSIDISIRSNHRVKCLDQHVVLYRPLHYINK